MFEGVGGALCVGADFEAQGECIATHKFADAIGGRAAVARNAREGALLLGGRVLQCHRTRRRSV